MTLGLLILLFVAYQLWGTGIFTARAQSDLKHQFAQAQQQYEQDTVRTTPPVSDPTPTTNGTATTTTTAPQRALTKPPPPIPKNGDPGGIIEIPRIHLKMAFVEGDDRDALKKGPGHYPDTPFPGTIGNAAIAGHRTTYLHPFYDIDKLRPGDKIIITTLAGKFTYKYKWQAIVKPTEVSVVDNTPDAELTLTSCNPKYSAAQRIVTRAVLVPNESAKPVKAQPPASSNGKSRSHTAELEEGLSGQKRSQAPTVLFGFIAALVGIAWWWAFRRWRHPLTWVIGVVPFLVALFPFYVYLERALPAGY